MYATPTDPSPAALPRQLTVFVGRRREVREIHELLHNPACRLLTLVGPGGIGKTRLALEAVASLVLAPSGDAPPATGFPDGVVFVPLQTATDSVTLITTLAQALHCPLTGSHDPRAQLVHRLAGQTMLLVLDNLEQLLDELDLLTDLLAAAPGVKILATSREVLNLANEWLYRVEGLTLPAAPDASPSTELSGYEAVQLFVERARHVRPDFVLQAEASEVAEICRLVGGLPLALEIAATWLNLLTCTEIAAEIRQSLDFLTTTRRDIPARHRSIRAVFDHSWRRLATPVTHVFKQLALFTGGFRRDAAQAVAGATLPTLATLMEHALLRWEPDTRRYQIHELLRQYALAELAQTPAVFAAAKARHRAYYIAFVSACAKSIVEGDQHAAIHAIELEIGNVRAAWQWAVDEVRAGDLIVLAPPLTDFYQMRGRYLEGATVLAQASQRLQAAVTRAGESNPDRVEALALLLTYQGSFYIRLGRIDAAAALLDEAQAYYRQANVPPLPGYNTDPHFSLGIIALTQGDYAAAARYGEKVRQTSECHDHRQNRQLAHYLLACAASAQGELAAAQQHAATACELARTTASHWFLAYCLNELGDIALTLGDDAAAHRHYTESYAIRAAFDDPEGMAQALVRLGRVALVQGDYAGAQPLYQQGLLLNERIDDKGGLATALAGLGQVAVGLHEWDAARDRFQAALDLALSIHYLPCLLEICYGAALLLMGTGDTSRGLALLVAVADHPSLPRGLANQIQQRMGGDLSYLAPDFLRIQRTRSTPVDLEQTARALLTMFGDAPVAPRAASPTGAGGTSAPVEPLSDRELELLQLIAAGRKNREIADALVISVNTVKVHIGNIYGKLGVSNRVQAVARAQELALL